MDYIVPNVRMTMNGRLGRMCNEVIVAYVKVVFQNLSGGTEENHTEPLNGKPVVEIVSLNSIKSAIY
jgi:hypothetical protein